MNAQSDQTTVDYKDVRFFLVFIPLVNLLNYYLTYSNISFNAHTAITFTIDTLQGFGAWWTMRSLIVYLDKRLPFPPAPLKRIIIQVMLTSIVGLAVIVLTTELLNAALKDTPVPQSFYRFDVFIFLIWFFVINGIYVSMYYYQLWKSSELLRREKLQDDQSTKALEAVIVKQGRQSLSVPVGELAAIYVEGEYVMLVTNSLKKHLHDISLEKLEKNLPAAIFFRINRQLILRRQFITGFERNENGKLTVIVSNPDSINVSLQVSRTKAAAFKSWFAEQQ